MSLADLPSSLLEEESDWARHDSDAQSQPAPRAIEVVTQDWRTPTSHCLEERARNVSKEKLANEERVTQEPEISTSQPSFQQQGSLAPQRAPPPIVKAANPWAPRRGMQSEKENVSRTVKGILNKLTPDKYQVLLQQLLQVGMNSADIFQEVISFIFDKAVLEPTFCPLYSELCVDLSKKLPELPATEPNKKPTSFRRILLDTCQKEFEGADARRIEIRQMTAPEQEFERVEKERKVKLRTLVNIKFIGKLFKQKMIPEKIVLRCIQELLGPADAKVVPVEENVEVLCQLLSTVGKQLEGRPIFDRYLVQLKELSLSKSLPSRLKFMVWNILDLRANKWVPRCKEVESARCSEWWRWPDGRKTKCEGLGLFPTEVGVPPARFTVPPMRLSKVGPNFGSRTLPTGSSAYFGKPRALLGNSAGGEQSNPRPIYGGVDATSQNPIIATRPVPATIVSRASDKETSSERFPPQGTAISTQQEIDLRKKSESLLLLYFAISDLREALLCVQELQSADYHPKFVQQALILGFEKHDREVELILKLLKYLHLKNVLSDKQVIAGIFLVAEQLEDVAMDTPMAPKRLGEVVAGLVSSGVLHLAILTDLLEKIESDLRLRRALFAAIVKFLRVSDGGERLLNIHRSDLFDCRDLLSGSAESDLDDFLQSEGISLSASVKAIESPTKADDQHWLTYWVLYSFLTLFEMAAWKVLAWIPLWPTLKLLLVSWLVLPQFQGAAFVYERFVRTYILANEKKIERRSGRIRTDVLELMSPDARSSVAQYIDENGEEAFDRMIVASPAQATKATRTTSYTARESHERY